MKKTRSLFALTLAIVSTLGAAASAQPKPTVTVSDDAKKHFKTGVDFLNDPDGARYEEAYRSFKLAYASSPSWKILGNLGLSAMKLERLGEAIESYDRYLAEGGSEIDASERTQIEKDVRLMKAAATMVSLSSPVGDASVVDQRQKANGSMAVNAYAVPAGKTVQLTLQAGRHVMTAKIGDREERWVVELVAGQTVTKVWRSDTAPTPAATAAPAPAPPPSTSGAPTTTPATTSSPLRTAGVVAMGVGGAMIVGGVVTGLMGKSKLSQLESECPNDRCPTAKQSDADGVHTLQTVTNVLWLGGAVVAGGGVAMFMIGNKKPAETARGVRVLPVATPGGGGLFAAGRF